MSNDTTPYGLIPIRHLSGIPIGKIPTTKCLIEDSYATACFMGDPVIITGAAGSDDTTGLYPPVNIATAGDGNRISGVIATVDINIDNLSKIYLPASTGGYVNVYTDPDIVYAIRGNGSATLSGNVIGANAVFASGSGNTFTGKSGWTLDEGTAPTADASYQVQILNVRNIEGNALGKYCEYEVLITNHVLRGGMAAADEGALGI